MARLVGGIPPINNLSEGWEMAASTMTDEEAASYFDIVKSEGEMSAARWLIETRNGVGNGAAAP